LFWNYKIRRIEQPLQTPYEIAAKSVIPAIRGMIAKSLINREMTQSEIAYFLGITQPAVSKYFSDKRGKAIDFDSKGDILKMTNLIAEGISERRLNRVQIANMIKEVCDYVMRSGYMCELHYGIDPQTKEMNCKMCMEAPAAVN
jgi:predicted transcriptional regulator